MQQLATSKFCFSIVAHLGLGVGDLKAIGAI